MKQGNPNKRMGIIAIIGAMLGGLAKKPDGIEDMDLIRRRNEIITNGGLAPIPAKFMNQRQKRKRNRQTNNFK